MVSNPKAYSGYTDQNSESLFLKLMYLLILGQQIWSEKLWMRIDRSSNQTLRHSSKIIPFLHRNRLQFALKWDSESENQVDLVLFCDFFTD